jgi:predicted phosphodiesterase
MKPIIKVPDGTKIAVVGDIHEHKQQFDQLVNQLQPSEKLWLVSVGDIYDKGFGPAEAEGICQTLQELAQRRVAYAIRGNHELKVLRKSQKPSQSTTPGLAWCRQLPLALFFEFSTGAKLTIVHGGVTSKHTWDDLGVNVETCYVRTVDEQGNMIRMIWVVRDGQKVLVSEKPNGKLWHEVYDGRFGYIASGHAAQKDGVAKFYGYSCNLDTACYDTGILTAQIFGGSGREDLISVQGPAAKPDLPVAEE